MARDREEGPCMAADRSVKLRDRVPGLSRLLRAPAQLLGTSPFSGTIAPKRVPLITLRSGRPSLPFPHPWNYREPLRILDTFFWEAENDEVGARHNRYLDVPGFAPVLVTRDPRVIRAISTDTGDKPGQFDRDTMPSSGIARATGSDSLLYANGSAWKAQKKLAMPPFARTTLFHPEQFHEFERTFRATVIGRLELVRDRIAQSGGPLEVELELEIKAIMLEMLVNNFFGAEVAYEQIRTRYVPAVDRVIHHIVRDTVVNKIGLPLRLMPGFTRGVAEAKEARAIFEELTEVALAPRTSGRGLWSQFTSDAPDDALRSNIRVFLAGALEATTSYASWAISHLARNPAAQERVYQEIRGINDYTPDALARAKYLGFVLDETLRLTPSLYFHPRRATADTLVTTTSNDTLMIPRGTHVLLDIWHANRHEDHWGRAITGYPANEFVPERWESISGKERGDLMHFGFGHGPRFCPGKSLGQLEVALVVGACVKLFHFESASSDSRARAGVSTKPLDGVKCALRPRGQEQRDTVSDQSESDRDEVASESRARCPFAHGSGGS